MILNETEKIVKTLMDENDWSASRAISEVAIALELEYGMVEREVRFAPITSPMSGAEIEKELGVTRQNVSQILKRALNKCYIHVKKMDGNMSPFEIANYMAQMFDIQKSDDLDKFFSLFPPKLKEIIKESALEQCRIEDQELIRKDENRIGKELQAMQELSQLQD
jgi:hypothetical protein